MDLREAIIDRQSIRNFKNEDVLEEHLKDIFYLATKAPSAFNGQQISILYTRDKNKIKEIAKLCGNQPQVENANVFILLVTDLYRADNVIKQKGFEIKKDLGNISDMIKIDAGIMAYLINIAAHSYGYGSTIIGGVYNNKEELKKLFNLPQKTEIAIGITLGVPNDSYSKTNTKPKLPVNVIAMEDTYDYEISKKALFEYEKELEIWFKSIGINQLNHTDILVKIFGEK